MTSSFALAFEGYAQQIMSRRSMVMHRFGDGELMLVDGHAVGANTQAGLVDRWQAPDRRTRLGQMLGHVLDAQGPNVHFGIPCTCCNPQGNARMQAAINRSPKFAANLFINGNYQRFMGLLINLAERPVALIVNERAMTCGLPFRAVRDLRVTDDCVRRFETEGTHILASAREFCSTLNATIVLVAAGPLSEVLLHVMWNTNPNNTYVDVGSAIDEYTYGHKTRPYQMAGNHYAGLQCSI